MTEPAAGAAVRFPPPFVPLIALVVGVVVDLWVWPFSLGVSGLLRYGLGGALVLTGLALMAAAMQLFRRTGQDPKPWERTPEIISTGIYRFTRNPMYLAMGLLQAGIGIALNNAWVVLAVVPVWVAIYYVAIRHEEAYLEREFGQGYLVYKKTVRRWL